VAAASTTDLEVNEIAPNDEKATTAQGMSSNTAIVAIFDIPAAVAVLSEMIWVTRPLEI